MERIIKKILKEELQGQEFIDNRYKEFERFESTKTDIIDYIKSQYPNLVDVEYKTKKVQLGSTIGFPTVDVIVVTLKFKDLSKYEMRALSSPVKEDIRNIFTNYFGFDVMAYGSPVELEFKAQAWVNF
jgi:hypothetical protein